jgi:hypothetical protein
MPTFDLQFAPDQIEALAGRFGSMDESRLLAIGARVRERGYYTRGEFIEVCSFKSVRSRPRIAANSRGAIVSATRMALASQDEGLRMQHLLALAGVGVPTASTLLYCAFPGEYPILDIRALESLGVKPRSQYPVSFWLLYLATCRALAASRGVSIRTLDKALWQHSKERSTSQ